MTTAGISGTGNPPGRPSMEGAEDNKKDQTVLQEMRDRFGSAVTNDAINRESYVQDVTFSSSADLWPEDVKKLRGDQRPTLTFNRLNGVIKQIIGDYRQNKLAIKVMPSGGVATEEVADILAGLLRNIEMESDADVAYVNALECSARGGFGWFRIITEYDGDDVFNQNLRIKPVHNPLTVYCDPSARLITRADARWMFVTELMPKDEFERIYPDASTNGFGIADGNSEEESITDWGNDSEIRVVEYFTKETAKARLVAFDNGSVVEIDDDSELEALEAIGWKAVKERETERTHVRWRKATALEILDERVYKTKYIPVIPVIGEEINIKGKVHTRSAIFYAKDAQRMYDYWKTAATESVALSAKAPWKVTAKEIEGYEDQWNNVNSAPQPYLVFNPDPEHPQGPERIQPPDQPIGEMAMAGQAGIDIQYTTGVFDASLGQRSNENSGVAISERQQQGATSTYIFIDNLRKAIEHCGKILIDWVPIVYDRERIVRVIGLEGDTSMETVNQQKVNPMMGITTVINDITVGKYDVVVETGPAFASRRREAVDGMTKFMTAMPQLGALIADLAVKNMDWPGADEIAARLKRALPPAITTDPDSPEGQALMQQQQQQQQQAAKAQQDLMNQKIQGEQSKHQADMAKSQATVIKAQAEVVKAKADTVQAIVNTNPSDHSSSMNPNPMEGNPDRKSLSVYGSRKDDLDRAAKRDDTDMRNTEEIKTMLKHMGNHLVQSHNMTTQQGQKLHELMGHLANNHSAVASALDHQNKIAMAPTEAIRDKTGRITGKRKVLNG